MKRLEEIEARAKAATSGPWHYDDGNIFGGPPWHLEGEGQEDIERHGIVARLCWPGCDPMDDPRWGAACEADEEFIAAAREDVPWLCEKLREAVALLECAEGNVGSPGVWTRRRDALLAALDEVTR